MTMILESIKYTDKNGYQITCSVSPGNLFSCAMPPGSDVEDKLEKALKVLIYSHAENCGMLAAEEDITLKSLSYKRDEKGEKPEKVSVSVHWNDTPVQMGGKPVTISFPPADSLLTKGLKEVEQQAQKYAQNKFWALNSQTSIFAGSGQADTEVEIEFNPATNEN